MPRIEGGTGKGNFARVNDRFELAAFATIRDEQYDATAVGNAYNINTGLIALTGSSASGVFYFKNNEPPVNGQSDIVITSIIIGMGTRSATVTDLGVATFIRNPTGGTIISGASAVDISSNANFGNTNSLDSATLVYKGADGNTITGGNNHAIAYLSETRNTIPLYIELTKGASLGITIDLNTSGGASVYVACVCYRKDGSIGR